MTSDEQAAKNPQTYLSLRERALHTKASDIGGSMEEKDVPYAALMETGYPNAAATLTAFVTGDASLYFSTGGGVIGGAVHEAVRDAARKFVALAKPFLPKLDLAETFPLPGELRVRFYVLTGRGIYTAEFFESDLAEKKSEFWLLFFAGHGVITELRRTVENIPGRKPDA